MNEQRKIELKRSIAEIENPYPEDDLILTYADFLKVRNNLLNYQFNPSTFYNLLNLTNNIWKTEKRINRLSLLQTTRQYFYITNHNRSTDPRKRHKRIYYPFSLDTRKLLFELFRKVFDESNYISAKQLEVARLMCNSMIIHIGLTPAEEQWLCSNTLEAEIILNRVLRYPIKSEIISNWAKNNFHNNSYRGRRPELTSWLIDQDPNFEVDNQTLFDDFEFLNASDLQAIKEYDDESTVNQSIENQLSDFLPKKRRTPFELFGSDLSDEEYVELSHSELKLSKRFYTVPFDSSKDYPVSIPDFDLLRHDFFNRIETTQKITMIWAIGYSRIDNDTKATLFQKYYCNETYSSLYRVSKKNNNSILLKWILEQQ